MNRRNNSWKRSAFLAAVVLTLAGTMVAQQTEYVAPAQATPHGSAPGMQVKLIATNGQTREFAVIFARGDEAMSGLTEFAKKYNVRAGHFTAIGGVHSAIVAWFDPQRSQFKQIPITEQSEVVSMVGDIAMSKGQPVVHAHMVVAGSDGVARGGHVLEANVWPTLEVFVTADAVELNKGPGPAGSGVSLIAPEKK